VSGAQPDQPAFELTADGTALTPAVAADVVELDVHEEVGRHARCTVLLQNWDPDQRVVRHSDDGPLRPGTAITVALGHHSDLTEVFDGVVTGLTTHFPAAGRPTLQVEARSRSVLLEHPPRSRQLTDVSDADLAAAVAADYGLTAKADDGVTRPAVVSDRTSDWAFLKARAERLGWVLYARGTDLVMRAPAAAQDPVELEYTRDIVELQLTEDITYAVDSAVGVSWDTGTLEAVDAEQAAAAAGLDHGDRDDHAAAVGAADWSLRTARDETDAESAADAADARAVGRQRDAALAHLYGRGVVGGDPRVRCDSWLTVTGVGSRMSGPHYVTAARHRLTPGSYLTEFQVGRPPALVPPSPAATGGGLALGVVESLDDPDSQLRVKVRLPWPASTPATATAASSSRPWARRWSSGSSTATPPSHWCSASSTTARPRPR
jgi:phage protein D